MRANLWAEYKGDFNPIYVCDERVYGFLVQKNYRNSQSIFMNFSGRESIFLAFNEEKVGKILAMVWGLSRKFFLQTSLRSCSKETFLLPARPHHNSAAFWRKFLQNNWENSLWQLPMGGILNPSGSAGKWKGRWPNAKWNCCCCPGKDNTVHLCMLNGDNYINIKLSSKD